MQSKQNPFLQIIKLTLLMFYIADSLSLSFSSLSARLFKICTISQKEESNFIIGKQGHSFYSHTSPILPQPGFLFQSPLKAYLMH